MAEDKKMNPLWLGLGLAAGAVGALFFSKEENRKKTTQALKKVQKSGSGWLSQTFQSLQETVGDVGALTQQDLTTTSKKKKQVTRLGKK